MLNLGQFMKLVRLLSCEASTINVIPEITGSTESAAITEIPEMTEVKDLIKIRENRDISGSNQ